MNVNIHYCVQIIEVIKNGSDKKKHPLLFLPRDAMHKRGLCGHAVSLRVCLCVCVPVTFVSH